MFWSMRTLERVIESVSQCPVCGGKIKVHAGVVFRSEIEWNWGCLSPGCPIYNKISYELTRGDYDRYGSMNPLCRFVDDGASYVSQFMHGWPKIRTKMLETECPEARRITDQHGFGTPLAASENGKWMLGDKDGGAFHLGYIWQPLDKDGFIEIALPEGSAYISETKDGGKRNAEST